MLPLEIEKLLQQDEMANMSMLGFFAKHEPLKILQKGESVMAMGKSDENWWYVSCKTVEDFDWFLENTSLEDKFIATIDDNLLEQVKERFTCRWILSCQRFYLPNRIEVSEPTLEISAISTADAEQIFTNSNYQTYTSVSYIKEQIEGGPGVAYHSNDKLVGWALTHDDGAMGMLHVLDNFRRQGIAKALVVDLIRKIREMGNTPFTYVEPSNCASLELIKGLGFVQDRIIHWVNLNR